MKRKEIKKIICNFIDHFFHACGSDLFGKFCVQVIGYTHLSPNYLQVLSGVVWKSLTLTTLGGRGA